MFFICYKKITILVAENVKDLNYENIEILQKNRYISSVGDDDSDGRIGSVSDC